MGPIYAVGGQPGATPPYAWGAVRPACTPRHTHNCTCLACLSRSPDRIRLSLKVDKPALAASRTSHPDPSRLVVVSTTSPPLSPWRFKGQRGFDRQTGGGRTSWCVLWCRLGTTYSGRGISAPPIQPTMVPFSSVSLRPFRDPGLLLGPKQRGMDLLRGARGQAVRIGQGRRVEVLLDCFDATARNVLLSR